MKLLIDERGRKYLVEGKELQTDLGIVNLERDEEVLASHLGHTFSKLVPDVVDIYEKMPRAGSLILKKDIGILLSHLGLGYGNTVVDAGTGSCALAIFMGHVVGPAGKVFTYEKNQEFAKIASGNVKLAGLQGIVDVKTCDVLDGFDEQNRSVDIVTLDMNESWTILDEVERVLKIGGRVGVYTPYIEHAKMVNLSLCKKTFSEVKTVEVLVREMEFRKQGTRPKTSRVGHSGYLTFGRKVQS